MSTSRVDSPLRARVLGSLAAVLVGATVLVATTALAGDADQGKSIYVAKCLACHGADGSGEGPASRALPRKPRDMTTAEFWDGTTDQQLEAVISTGKPGSAMRAFPMNEAQMGNLIAYLRTFQPT